MRRSRFRTVASPLTAGMALNIGDTAPDFELPNHTGRLVRLCDFCGKSSVILAFYVYANTPG